MKCGSKYEPLGNFSFDRTKIGIVNFTENIVRHVNELKWISVKRNMYESGSDGGRHLH